LENFYQILDVPETATQEEIKKAYRKKAIESHPDKGGDEEVFKKISEAYDVLGNEGKRREYDNNKNNPFGGFDGDPFNMFHDFFNNVNQNKPRKAPDKVVELNIGTLDSYIGKNIDINYNRKINCNPCNGKGGERVTCSKCNGSGRLTQRIGNSFFSNIVQIACDACSGQGFSLKNVCFSCAGEGKNNEMKTININLPHGITDGQMIKAKQMGDYHEGSFGDIIFKIKVNPQDGFDKANNDLVYNYQMSLDDFNKDTIDVPHPSGNLNIKLPEEIDTTKPLRVKGKGFRNDGIGDFYVNMYVKHKRS
jgi:molecular chaperone DnaJ